VRFSVLVNGSLSSFFNSSRGLRQGDPISPLLFVVALNKMSTAIVDKGLLSSFSVDSRLPVVNISHLLFADDTLVFCGANPDHLCYMRVFLLCFEAVSGLKINLAKSDLVLVGNVDNVVELANILGCGISSPLLKYLGMPLGDSYKAKSIWDGILEKMERWLEKDVFVKRR
jgi:hypothetical protein